MRRQVKFLLWGLDKPEDFFDQPELWWLVLANEIKLTDKQLEELRNHQGSFIKVTLLFGLGSACRRLHLPTWNSRLGQERKQLQQLHKMLGEFRKYIQTHLSNVHYEIEQLKNLLTYFFFDVCTFRFDPSMAQCIIKLFGVFRHVIEYERCYRL